MKTLKDLTQVESKPELSFAHSDIEKKLGLPSGRYTNAGFALPFILAILFTVGFYSALMFIPDNTLNKMFTQRGIIPYTIVFLSFWSLSILMIKSVKLRLQRKALQLNIIPTVNNVGFILTPSSAEQILSNLYKKVDDPEYFLLTRRIHATLSNLKNIGRIADVGEVLRTQAQNDEDVVDSSYTILRGFIWAIPVLGFIGTVLGLSIALGSFGNVLSNTGNITDLKDALKHVTAGLSTAFDTTLEGLVAALFIHLLMIALRRREEQFLDDCTEYCQKYIVGRLKLFE